jgi:glycosyltransferase involved in cell wall biosynthesis
MRIAILASGLTGYLDACLGALLDRDVELLIVTKKGRDNVAYESLGIETRTPVIAWAEDPDPDELIGVVKEFGPDAALMHSWDFKPYRAVMRSLRGDAVRVLWMDNNWLETPKQWIGRLTSSVYVQPVFDVAFLPGDRTEAFARRLGFTPENVIRGSLSADTTLFGCGPVAGEELAHRGRFASALRMVHHKGADVLAEGYKRYRDLVANPWGLELIGTGPLLRSFDGVPGVIQHGFLQPAEVAAVMHRSSCYVNPSRAEPYGVVLHEAAAAALPILTSHMVGAAPTLVQDGYNGWWVPAGRADHLADAMARVSDLDAARLGEFSATSHALSRRLSPSGWARNLHEELARRTMPAGRRSNVQPR